MRRRRHSRSVGPAHGGRRDSSQFAKWEWVDYAVKVGFMKIRRCAQKSSNLFEFFPLGKIFPHEIGSQGIRHVKCGC